MALGFTLLGIVLPQTGTAQPFLHGGALLKNPVGPDGTPRAHVGDTITNSITIINLDDFGDTLTITNVIDIVHHAGGDVISPNLISSPVTLDSYLISGGNNGLEVTNTYVVLAADANRPDGILADDADAGGVDNHDGSLVQPPSFIKQSMLISSIGQVFVVMPCLDVTKSCADGVAEEGLITFRGTVTNCGNTLLTNVVLSNFVNGAFVWVLGPTNLELGQAIALTNSYPPANPCEPSADTLWAFGTDELGLAVSANSGPVTCFNPAGTNAVRLTIAQRGGNMVISWPQTCTTYAVERSSNLVTWGTAPGTVFPVGSAYNLTNPAAGTFFYRLRK